MVKQSLAVNVTPLTVELETDRCNEVPHDDAKGDVRYAVVRVTHRRHHRTVGCNNFT